MPAQRKAPSNPTNLGECRVRTLALGWFLQGAHWEFSRTVNPLKRLNVDDATHGAAVVRPSLKEREATFAHAQVSAREKSRLTQRKGTHTNVQRGTRKQAKDLGERKGAR